MCVPRDKTVWDEYITSPLFGPASLPDLRGIRGIAGPPYLSRDQLYVTPPVQLARLYYNQLFECADPTEINIVIPICDFKPNREWVSPPSMHPYTHVFYRATAPRLNPSPTDVYHKFHRPALQNQRLMTKDPRKTGTHNGLFPTGFAKVVHAMGPPGLIGPDVLLLWPVWVANSQGRLPGLLPAIFARYAAYGEQLSFCLSRWLSEDLPGPNDRKIWAFLPLDCVGQGYSVTFDEKSTGAIREPEEEERIWAYPGVRIVFYKTRKPGLTYKSEMEDAVKSVKKHQKMSSRRDQKILKKWMEQAATRTGDLRRLPPFNTIQSPFPTPRTAVTIRVENNIVAQTYTIPGDRVYLVSFDV
jgi:hypothetical protein